MSDQPKACGECGSADLDGPYGSVCFCNTCGRSVRVTDGRSAHKPPQERAFQSRLYDFQRFKSERVLRDVRASNAE